MAGARLDWTIRPTAQIGRKLGAVATQAGPALAALAQFHAGIGEGHIKSTTAYTDRTGNLRGSSFGRAEGHDIIIGATAHYAIYLELGTSKMRAREFIRPAAQATAPAYFKDGAELHRRLLGGGW